MDIPGMDISKTKMRLIMWLAQRELQRNADKYQLEIKENKTVMEAIQDDLRNCSNPVVRRMYKQLLEASEHMKTKHHTTIIRDFGSFLLWVCYKDTAYRDPFFWLIKNICDDKELQESLTTYYREPSKWYCPTWTESKNKTKELRDKGLINSYDMSSEEEIFVPKLQHEKWVEIMDKELEVNARKKLWL